MEMIIRRKYLPTNDPLVPEAVDLSIVLDGTLVGGLYLLTPEQSGMVIGAFDCIEGLDVEIHG